MNPITLKLFPGAGLTVHRNEWENQLIEPIETTDINHVAESVQRLAEKYATAKAFEGRQE